MNSWLQIERNSVTNYCHDNFSKCQNFAGSSSWNLRICCFSFFSFHSFMIVRQESLHFERWLHKRIDLKMSLFRDGKFDDDFSHSFEIWQTNQSIMKIINRYLVVNVQRADSSCLLLCLVICSCDDVERMEGISNCKMDRKLKMSGFRFLTTAFWEKMCVVTPVLDWLFLLPVWWLERGCLEQL